MRPRYVQADELWTFVHTKERRLSSGAPCEWGNAYVWIALDNQTKLILSHYVGKRDAVGAYEFIRDLCGRVMGRFQITTDGLLAYIEAVDEWFGPGIDYA